MVRAQQEIQAAVPLVCAAIDDYNPDAVEIIATLLQHGGSLSTPDQVAI